MANWKLNGNFPLIRELASVMPEHVSHTRIVICPPYPYLSEVQSQFPKASIAGQDCSQHDAGAFTGEVSASMLKEMGCDYVIVGHSERRQHHAETNVVVKNKAAKAIENGVKPIICIGETLAERQGGFVLEVLEKQYKESLPDSASNGNCLVAYEPVWAIGTGEVATLEQIEAVHAHLKSFDEKLPLLYGGSVKPNNIGEICAVQGVDGVLVGSASIDLQSLAAMLTV